MTQKPKANLIGGVLLNQWDHIKDMRTASKLTVELVGAPQDYNNLHLPKTQNVIGRLISFGIRCTWTEDDVQKLATNISVCVNKALKPQHA